MSMTGYGESRQPEDGLVVGVEVRTVNNRYFKISLRLTDGYAALESEIEELVRARIKRGTVQLNINIDREPVADDFRINATALRSYRDQVAEVYREWDLPPPSAELLALPGVVVESTASRQDASADWPAVRRVLKTALDKLEAMRRTEGAAMAANLTENCRNIAAELAQIRTRAPEVVADYRRRLEERMSKWLAEHDLSVESSDLLREVGVFSERCDISEEIVRLESHLEQFQAAMTLPDSSGRKLEFISQEMFREINTIGSKANDVEIGGRVIEIKAAIERMREMIQNVE